MFPFSPKVRLTQTLAFTFHSFWIHNTHTCNLPPAKFRILLLVLLLVYMCTLSGKDSSLTYPKIYINNQHQGLCQNKMVVWFCKGCVCIAYMQIKGYVITEKGQGKGFFLNAKINIWVRQISLLLNIQTYTHIHTKEYKTHP